MPNRWLREDVGIELPDDSSRYMEQVVLQRLGMPLAPLLRYIFGDGHEPRIHFLRETRADQALCGIVVAMQKAGRANDKDQIVYLYNEFCKTVRAITGGAPDGMSSRL